MRLTAPTRLSVRIVLGVATSLPLAAQQGVSIAHTKHNLSVAGPGPFRAQAEGQICIFCHAPHNARLQIPLWNRNDSVTSYLTYHSSTFQGSVGQPNGTSKLCLSCHDGTIALGSVVSLNEEIAMQPGRRLLDSGGGFLGSNLRDDHPVSFHYASSRGGSGVGYRSPGTIGPPVRLDHAGLLQCTSCHDPHDDQHGRFLLRTDRQSEICLACHEPTGWSMSAHALSTRAWSGGGENPWPFARYTNVRDNGCANCHRSHGAGYPERLLVFAAEEDNCLRCHSGSVALKNIQADLNKSSHHDPFVTTRVHDPAENPLTAPRHAECQDCHDPHQARAGSVAAPGVPGPLLGVSGINSTGAFVLPITFGYELCFKCHSSSAGPVVHTPRQIVQTNTRLEFDPGNPSHHAVVAPGRNGDVPSLLAPWTVSSVLACTDCHDSDSSPAIGGNGARGPHGSVHRPLLKLNHTTADNTSESSTAYALCYSCHSRSSILNDVTFKEHRKHIVGERTPCSACHDPHGISHTQGSGANHSHLINFDTSIVFPHKNVRSFVDLGSRRGNCTLTCHGKEHDAKDY